MILLIDNYDSFTWNLYQYFCELGADVLVRRNDELTLAQIDALSPQKIVISPGPCTPDDAGISLEVIRYYAGKIPLLGVCLGHQAMAQAFGATVVRAAKVMHGKTSPITHNGQGVFQGAVSAISFTLSLVLRTASPGINGLLLISSSSIAASALLLPTIRCL